MIIQVPNLEAYVFDDTNLHLYLDRVREGNDVIYRTTFYKGKNQQTVLSNWKRRLNTIAGEFPSLIQFEEDLCKKVGPMSVMQPLDKRISDVESYYDSIGRESTPIDTRAISAVSLEWESVAADNIVCRSQKDTVAHMKLSTNSGTPYFTKRRNVITDSYPVRIKFNGSDSTMTTPSWIGRFAAVIGWRGQEGGPNPEDVKQRVVWMFPFSVNIAEQSLYQPLIESFQRHKLVPAWISNDYVDLTVTQLFDTKAPEDLVVCTDFTKFDQHFNQTLASTAKQLIGSLVRDSAPTRDWLENVFPVKYHIPLILSEGSIATGVHGMGSGSGGTNFDETLVHRTLQHEAACMAGATLNPYSQCLGDDGVLTYPGIQVSDVVRSYSQHGLEMNETKQYAAADHCIYLRRWHHHDYRINDICVGVYSTYRALGRLMYQERYYDPDVWGPKMVALRQLSILENVKYHPLREEFARYCMRGDKYRLGLDIPGFLANIEREAMQAIDYMPDFLGYNRTNMEQTSIRDWWIVQFLRRQ